MKSPANWSIQQLISPQYPMVGVLKNEDGSETRSLVHMWALVEDDQGSRSVAGIHIPDGCTPVIFESLDRFSGYHTPDTEETF